MNETKNVDNEITVPRSVSIDLFDGALQQTTVFLKKIRKKPQKVSCPFCKCKIRAQWIPNGVMTGWDEECKHYYAAGDNSALEPALVFRRSV